mmetsp:Transcript_7972/g.23974  ORF Transcript_7972/g.23974 Transcript_7972/m.23974 type:complete len:126 (+) Transcript_7972:255-632(+)
MLVDIRIFQIERYILTLFRSCLKFDVNGYLARYLPTQACLIFALTITSYIIIEGFMVIAPVIFSKLSHPAGALFYLLSIIISWRTVRNFYMACTTDPGYIRHPLPSPAPAGKPPESAIATPFRRV